MPALPACADSSTPTASASITGTAPSKQLSFTGVCTSSAYKVLYSLDGSTPSTEWDGSAVALASGSVTVKARLALSGYALGPEVVSESVDNTPATSAYPRRLFMLTFACALQRRSSR